MAQCVCLPIYKKGDDCCHVPPPPTIDRLLILENSTMCNLHLILGFTLAASLPFATAQAAPADLPETGQTSCYTAAGVVTACATTRQDGDLKAGVAWPIPRFVVGTGAMFDCVTDNLTGLMWVKTPSAVNATWANALTSANNLTLCGFSDWRLPNVNELESLVNSEAPNQANLLTAQGFSGVQAHNYWSSSTDAGTPYRAWFVSMLAGEVSAGDKTFSFYVWPVRAGR
jgi:hypothetical protein